MTKAGKPNEPTACGRCGEPAEGQCEACGFPPVWERIATLEAENERLHRMAYLTIKLPRWWPRKPA